MKSIMGTAAMMCVLGAVCAQKDEPEEKEPVLPQGKVSVAIDPGRSVAPLHRVYWLPDGKHLVTTGGDNAVRLWDAETLTVVKTVHLPSVGRSETRTSRLTNGAVISRDGKRLAVGGRHVGADGKVAGVVFLLTIPECRLERTLHGCPFEPTTLALSPDGTRLAAGTADAGNKVRLWDLTAARPSAAIMSVGTVRDLALSPDNKTLASTRVRAAFHSLEKDGRVGEAMQGVIVAFARDGKSLYTVAASKLWEYDRAGKEIRAVTAPIGSGSGGPRSLVLGRDGKALLLNGVHLYDFAGRTWRTLTNDKADPENIFDQGDISPDGRYVATAGSISGRNSLRVIDAATGRLVRRTTWNPWFDNALNPWQDANFSADGLSLCWTATKDGARQPAFESFSLARLELQTTAKSRAQPQEVERKRGALALRETKRNAWQVVEGDKPLAAFTGYPPVMVTKDRVARYASAARRGLTLFDARTGKALESAAMRPIVFRFFHATPDGRYVLTGHTDQTMTVWTVDPLAPLLNFYKSGNDWIAWTPEGYYAATPGGETFLRWKVDNGPDALPSVYAADRFRKRFHRPDVIKKAFELGSVQKALEALDGKGAKAEKVEDLLPPAVRVAVLKQEGDKATVKVTAKAQVKGQPVTALRLMLDGMPFPGLDAMKYDKPRPEAEWTLTVRIPPGRHTLGALVRSEDASARADAVAVEWRAKEDRPTLHLVAVGINEYQGGIPKLTCAANDARDLAKAFASAKSGDLFRDVVIHDALTDKAATSKAVREKLTALRKVVNRGDVVVVFFAGHGTLSKGDFYFLTHDSVSDKIGDDNALSGKRLAESLGGLGCRVLLLLDACHAGAADLKPASDDAARGLSDDDVGVTVLSAAQGKQKARERDGNGLFTLAIKEAFSDAGKAPRSGDGRLFVHHLYAHVSDRVGELSGFEQTPFLRLPDGVPPFALRRFSTK